MSFLPSFLPSLRPLPFGLETLSFLVSCILRVDWRTKSEREAKGRRRSGGAAPPPGSIDLMTAHFRGLYAPRALTTPTR